MTHGRLRMACVLTAGFCTAVAWEIWTLGGASGPLYSPLTLAAFATAGLGALICLLAVWAPGRWWEGIEDRFERARSWLLASQPPRASGVATAMTLAGLIAYVVLLWRFVPLQASPENNDQGAYLQVAQEVQQNGGLPNFLGELFRGDFAEANRHPLYIALLSFAPEFRVGQLLSAAIGTIALIALTLLVARRFGGVTAGVFCVLLATNFAFCYFSSRVVCEILLTLLAGLTWLAAPLGRKLLHSGPLRFCGLGALLGLAYLTKATGLLLLVGTVVWLPFVVIRVREQRDRLKAVTTNLLLVVLGFLVTASPLLVRNVIRFGSPFYNVNSYLLFVDEYRDPQTLAEEMSLNEAAGRYWQTHSVGEMAGREMSGLVWETFILCRMLGPAPLDDSRALFGIILLLLGAVGLTTESEAGPLFSGGPSPRAPARGRPLNVGAPLQCGGRSLIVIWTVLFVVIFAWYVPIAAGERFLMPLLMPLLAYASCGIVRVVSSLWNQTGSPYAARILFIGGLSWCVLWAAWTSMSGSLADRFTS